MRHAIVFVLGLVAVAACGSKATDDVTSDTKTKCAGFGAAQAAEILDRKISFSLSLEGSADEAKRSLEGLRESYVIAARARDLMVVVMLPNDQRTQVAVARKILERL